MKIKGVAVFSREIFVKISLKQLQCLRKEPKKNRRIHPSVTDKYEQMVLSHLGYGQ